MTDNVIEFRTANPDTILEEFKGEMQGVLVLGYSKDGSRVSALSNGLTDGGDILWLIENFKRELLNGEFNK